MYKSFEEAERAYYGYWYSETPKKIEAIKIAEYCYETFKEHHDQIVMDLIVFYGSMGEVMKCKNMLHIGFERGNWYPKEFLGEFFLQEDYKEEIKLWEDMKKKSTSHSEAIYETILPRDFDEESSYPLFVSLHGWGENIKMFSKFWNSNRLKSDYIHLIIQSSQMIGSFHYTWKDREISKKDIYRVMDEVKSDYHANDFVIIGGFSEGGTTAMDLALQNPSLFNGFISLCPGKPKHLDDELIMKASKNGLRGGIITGDKDKSFKKQLELIDTFKKLKLPCDLKIKENFGHWFPDDLDLSIDEMVDYISYGNMNYSQLLNIALELYGNEQYQYAYDFITKFSKEVICNDAQIFNFRYSIACKTGNYQLGMSILKEAVLVRKFWYSYDYLLSDDDLKPLYEMNSFSEVAMICKEREKEANKNAEAKLFIIDKRNLKLNEKAPLVIALHGDQENYEIVKEEWDKDIFTNYILAFPQSSVEEFSTGFVWSDPKKGVAEIVKHVKFLKNAYDINENDVTLAAFSSGCSVVLQAIIDKSIKASKIILISPWLPNMEVIRKKINVIKKMNIKIFIACGDEDEDCFESTKKLSGYFDDSDIPHEFYMLEGLGHEYPSEMEKLLEHATDYFK